MPRKQKIVLRNGTTAPSAGDFDVAEPAWDKSSGRLYVKDAAGAMVEVTTPAASTSTAGKVQLEDSTSSTSTTKAATPNSVKTAYDLANGKADANHTHGNITNVGAIGSTANLPVITTTGGVLNTGTFGTGANTFCQGNDSRLSDTRTPTDGTVTNAKVASGAAIAGTKISPDFGAQNVTTTSTSTAASFIPTSSTAPANGMYLSAANTLAFNTNSAASPRAVIDSSGRLGINTTDPSAAGATAYRDLVIAGTGNRGITVQCGSGSVGGLVFNTSNGGNAGGYIYDASASQMLISAGGGSGNIAFSTGVSQRAAIDSSGRLLVGTSSSRSNAFGQPDIQLESGSAILSATQVANNQYGGAFVLAKARGTSFQTVTNNDNLGIFSFQGANGSALVEGARIQADIDGVVSGGGAGDLPTRLVFSTTADGAGSPTERLRITSTGQVRLAGAGITFNGDTAAANELDDYEEGTFTPTIVGTSTAGTGTYSVNTGNYTKIGNRVLFTARLTWSAHTGTGNIQINGLPFTAGATAPICLRHSNLASPAGTVIQGNVVNAASNMILESIATGGGTAAALAIDTAADLIIQGQYNV